MAQSAAQEWFGVTVDLAKQDNDKVIPDGEWIQDAGPTDWFNESVSISYFRMDSSERRTPVRTAAYTIPPSPNELDSDGDGVPDYVEIQYGLDPVNSGADSDDDGFSNLEEILAGTNPNLNSSSPPAKETDTDGDRFSSDSRKFNFTHLD